MLFYDLHSDLPTSNLQAFEQKVACEKNQKGGVRVINAIYNNKNCLDNAIFLAKYFLSLNVDIAFEDCCYFSYLNSGDKPLSEKIYSLINILCSFNPKYISLGWNNDNIFLGGCAGNGDLTNEGRLVVKLLNEKGVVVDCAHSNKKSFYSLLEHSNRLICSHSAFEWVFPHKRNLDKAQVKALIDRGGIIGLVGVGHFLTGIKGSKKNYEQAFFEHLYGYIQQFGSKALCIATDFYGSDATVYEDGDYNFIYNLKNKLVKSGINDSDIDNILYKNALNYFNNH